MVALSGPGWRLAPSLEALVEETDRLYPGRDMSSDGSIGDADHASRASDHNPDEDGFVCALDIDEDVSPAVHTLAPLADAIVARRDPRIAYLIYEGWVCKSYVDGDGDPAWTWQPYVGSNDHSRHLHVSVKHTDAGRLDTRPWWPSSTAPGPQPSEDDELNDTEKRQLKEAHLFTRRLAKALGIDDLATPFDEFELSCNGAARLDKVYEQLGAGKDGLSGNALARLDRVWSLAVAGAAAVSTLTDQDLADIAQAVADEQARRQVE